MTHDQQIKVATERKLDTLRFLNDAYCALCNAQGHITNVEGEGSAALYDDIADAYQMVDKLRGRLAKIKPTGLFTP